MRLTAQPRRADPPGTFILWRHRVRLSGAISPTAVNAIAGAIQQQEGYYPGSVSYTNNNPGNLVYAGQPGATPGPGGFAKFQTLADGQNALLNQINLDATRGTDVNGNPTTTIAQLISSWAPSSAGNDTASYIANVSATTGYDPNAPLSSLGYSDLQDLTDAGIYAGSPTGFDLSGLGISWGSIGGIAAAVFAAALLARR